MVGAVLSTRSRRGTDAAARLWAIPDGVEMAYQIGWIGAGVMGSPMAGHLIDAGHRVTVHTRTKGKATALIEAGAAWADSLTEACDGADFVFTMLGTPDDVERVVLGDSGVLESTRSGATLIDMTTSEPALAERIHRVARDKGIDAIDAPVSGGDVGARNATLSIMAGGDREAFDRALPLLETLGRSITYLGPAGSGQHTKAVNQLLIAGTMMGLAEGLLYAERAGLDANTVVEAVSGGAAGSWSLDNYAPRILDGDLEPGFAVRHYVKDLRIALREAERLGTALPASALAHQLYVGLAAQGHADKGVHALGLGIDRLSRD